VCGGYAALVLLLVLLCLVVRGGRGRISCIPAGTLERLHSRCH
jgi:hypothetical protein